MEGGETEAVYEGVCPCRLREAPGSVARMSVSCGEADGYVGAGGSAPGSDQSRGGAEKASGTGRASHFVRNRKAGPKYNLDLIDP